jgi:hypothetical protein
MGAYHLAPKNNPSATQIIRLAERAKKAVDKYALTVQLSPENLLQLLGKAKSILRLRIIPRLLRKASSSSHYAQGVILIHHRISPSEIRPPTRLDITGPQLMAPRKDMEAREDGGTALLMAVVSGQRSTDNRNFVRVVATLPIL